MGVAVSDSTHKAEVGTTCRALVWFEAFGVHLDGLADILGRGSEPDPERRLTRLTRLRCRKFLDFVTNNDHGPCSRGEILELREGSI